MIIVKDADFFGFIFSLISAVIHLLPALLSMWMARFAAKRLGRNRSLWGWSIFLAVIGIEAWFLWFRMPVPGDAEIIARFETHREVLDELVQRRRNHRTKAGGTLWVKQPEIVSLMQQAGIKRIIGDNIGGMWLSPDPYRTITVDERMRISSELNQAGGSATWAYGGAAIKFAGSRGLVPLRGFISKSLWHVPADPLVKDGYLWWPYYERAPDSPHLTKRRVLDSLDSYPEDFGQGGCVFRRLDTRWFIKLCRSY